MFGHQVMEMTGITGAAFASSKFKCASVAYEVRAELTGAGAADFTIKKDCQSAAYAHCTLVYVSLYKSPEGIPGMRFDYRCSGQKYGWTESSIMIGLKKVPEGTPTPGLGAFFKAVCTKGPATSLYFASIINQGSFQWVKSADQEIISSPNCFDKGAIFTFLSWENYFPIFPVTESDWDYLASIIPAPWIPSQHRPHPVLPPGGNTGPSSPCDTTTPSLSSPCDTTTPNVPVPVYFIEYGFAVVDRICLHFPEMPGDNKCCKFCYQQTTTTTTPTRPCPPPYCYDCTWDEIWYALLATCIVWRFMRCCCGGASVSAFWFYWSGYDPHNGLKPYEPMIRGPRNVYDANQAPFLRVFCTTGMSSLLVTGLTYFFINMMDFLISEVFLKKEMCIKILNFELGQSLAAHVQGGGAIFGIFDWYDYHYYACGIMDIVCFWRLAGLAWVTWMSVWWVYLWALQSEMMGMKEVIVVETEYKVAEGAAAGAGAGGGAGFGWFGWW